MLHRNPDTQPAKDEEKADGLAAQLSCTRHLSDCDAAIFDWRERGWRDPQPPQIAPARCGHRRIFGTGELPGAGLSSKFFAGSAADSRRGNLARRWPWKLAAQTLEHP